MHLRELVLRVQIQNKSLKHKFLNTIISQAKLSSHTHTRKNYADHIHCWIKSNLKLIKLPDKNYKFHCVQLKREKKKSTKQ